MDYKVIGKNIRKVRKSMNMTQEKLSELIDLSSVFISQIENGVGKPSLETIFKLSELFNVPMDILVKSTTKKKLTSDLTEINSLLQNRTKSEIYLVTSIVRELLTNLKDGSVIEQQ